MAKDLISRKRKPTTGDSSIGKSAKKQKPQKKDTKKKVESSDESDDGKRKKIVHEEEGDDNHDDVQEEEIEDGNDFGDGLANTMAALLKQTTKSKVPVLAGRKTSIMKQLEAHKQDNVLQMQKRDERRQKIREKMSHTVANIEVEKQLKKLATKGVVALFNAVAKAKRDTVLEESSKSKPHKEDDTILSREANNSRSSNHKSLSNKSTEPKDKVWKVINDSTEDIPMDWDKDEYDD